MIRGPFLGRCHLGICLPESRTSDAATPQAFPENAPSCVVLLQAPRNENVVQPISQAAGVECSGTVADIKPRQRIAVDQRAIIFEQHREVRRLSVSDGWPLHLDLQEQQRGHLPERVH